MKDWAAWAKRGTAWTLSMDDARVAASRAAAPATVVDVRMVVCRASRCRKARVVLSGLAVHSPSAVVEAIELSKAMSGGWRRQEVREALQYVCITRRERENEAAGESRKAQRAK